MGHSRTIVQRRIAWEAAARAGQPFTLPRNRPAPPIGTEAPRPPPRSSFASATIEKQKARAGEPKPLRRAVAIS